MNEDGPLLAAGKRHTDALAGVKAEKPSSFTVGGFVDGRAVEGHITFDRKWSTGWGLTAYARAWWNDQAVLPVPATPEPKAGSAAGFDVRKGF